MKTEYEEKVFEFFTKEQNFSAAARIADQLGEIALELVKNFWHDLANKLDKVKDPWGDGWRIKMTEKYEQRYSGLEVTHRDWMIGSDALVAIRFEDLHYTRYPYIGFWINRDLEVKVSYNNIYDEIRALNELKEYEHDSHQWWMKWKRLSYIGFDTYQKLEGIIPANRSDTIDRCISEVVTLKDLATDQITEIVGKYS
ncbi:MAG: hypothetical protein AAF616_14115 [Bacteroidota bacterium]